MKNTKIILIIAACVLLICGGFYFSMQSDEPSEEQLTEVQKIVTKDLENDYPKTPREVVKLYNRIVDCYYGTEISDAEIKELALQMRGLLDEELLGTNSEEEYYNSVLEDVAYYEANKMYIVEANVCDTNEVKYITDSDNGDSLAYVSASYFMKEGEDFVRTYQNFVLRKDEDGKWKILTFYVVEGEA